MKKYKKKESNDVLKILDSVNNIEKYQKDKHDQRKNLDYKNRWKNKLLREKIKYKKLISKKHKKGRKILNYNKHLFILASTITRWASISAFAYSVGIPVGFSSSSRRKAFQSNPIQ